LNWIQITKFLLQNYADVGKNPKNFHEFWMCILRVKNFRLGLLCFGLWFQLLF